MNFPKKFLLTLTVGLAAIACGIGIERGLIRPAREKARFKELMEDFEIDRESYLSTHTKDHPHFQEVEDRTFHIDTLKGEVLRCLEADRDCTLLYAQLITELNAFSELVERADDIVEDDPSPAYPKQE